MKTAKQIQIVTLKSTDGQNLNIFAQSKRYKNYMGKMEWSSTHFDVFISDGKKKEKFISNLPSHCVTDRDYLSETFHPDSVVEWHIPKGDWDDNKDQLSIFSQDN